MKALIHQAQAEGPRNESSHRYGDAEKDLTEKFHQAQLAFRAALCDSYNTPVALDVIRDIVSRTNVYIKSRNINTNLDVSVVERVARWVGEMLRMFGLGEGESSEIGWGQDAAEGEENVNVSNVPLLLGRRSALLTTLNHTNGHIARGNSHALSSLTVLFQRWGSQACY